uniref:Uncharacterized protein n=1 Tax=Romanomermis culicivorax TaxID=13658 RepID=A0A915KKH5_ROMCU
MKNKQIVATALLDHCHKNRQSSSMGTILQITNARVAGTIIEPMGVNQDIRKSKPYEKVIFATLLTDLCTCFNYGCLQPYAILGHATMLCKAAGFSVCLFLNMNQVWIPINMFSRYLALYHQVLDNGADESQAGLGSQDSSLMYLFPTPVFTRLT